MEGFSSRAATEWKLISLLARLAAQLPEMAAVAGPSPARERRGNTHRRGWGARGAVEMVDAKGGGREWGVLWGGGGVGGVGGRRGVGRGRG